jgi:hypothetical protein
VTKPKTQSTDIVWYYGIKEEGNIAEKYEYVGLTPQDGGR